MRVLSNNRELYEYLRWLSSELKARGTEELGEAVARASRQASSMSTEFLGESRIALRKVDSQVGSILSQSEHEDIVAVLRQLDKALDGR